MCLAEWEIRKKKLFWILVNTNIHVGFFMIMFSIYFVGLVYFY